MTAAGGSGVVQACQVRDWGLREALEAFDAALAASSARELAGGGDAGYYLRQVALQNAVADWMRIGATVSGRGWLATEPRRGLPALHACGTGVLAWGWAGMSMRR